MTSSFENWSAYDIVGPLNRAEVRAVLLDYGFERKHFRSWNSIETLILSSSDEVKNVVFECAEAKRKVEEDHRRVVLKRRLDDQTFRRNVRQRIGSFFFFKNKSLKE
jgi:hypothetical protein